MTGEKPLVAVAGRFLTFRDGGKMYALPAEQVAEIIRVPNIARVPQAPRGVLGVANLRGTVLPMTSFAGLTGRSPGDHGDSTRVIILEGHPAVGVVVDEVKVLTAAAGDGIDLRQREVSAKSEERVLGTFAVGDQGETTKVLDIASMVGAAFATDGRRASRGVAVSGVAEQSVRESVAPGSKIVTFNVAGQEYALALAEVREVVETSESVAPLAGSEEVVLGMVAIRDGLVPLLSLRGLLGFPMEPTQATGRIVVTSVRGAPVGLLADAVGGIVVAKQSEVDEVPQLLAARVGGETRISAIHRGDSGRRLISIISPETLFREDVMQHLVASAATAVSAAAPTTTEDRGEVRQFIVFRLADEEFGLPIEVVEEVARVPDEITRLPRTPPFLEGVVNLRGTVLPVLDQRRRFDLAPRDGESSRRLLVVNTERHRAGLIVDGISEVLRAFAGDIDPAPQLAGESIRLFQGILNLEPQGRLILILDPAELLTQAEQDLLDAFKNRMKRAPL